VHASMHAGRAEHAAACTRVQRTSGSCAAHAAGSLRPARGPPRARPPLRVPPALLPWPRPHASTTSTNLQTILPSCVCGPLVRGTLPVRRISMPTLPHLRELAPRHLPLGALLLRVSQSRNSWRSSASASSLPAASSRAISATQSSSECSSFGSSPSCAAAHCQVHAGHACACGRQESKGGVPGCGGCGRHACCRLDPTHGTARERRSGRWCGRWRRCWRPRLSQRVRP
jgi:hypothetical protein